MGRMYWQIEKWEGAPMGDYIRYGNCYRTKKDALKAVARLKKAFKEDKQCNG
jgi:hypothetical protein